MKICENCGKEQNNDIKFCKVCGNIFIITPNEEENPYIQLNNIFKYKTPKAPLKIPSLKYLGWDDTNPDLDKRYTPINSCQNCFYVNKTESIYGTKIHCNKNNYIVKDYLDDYDNKYTICDDHITTIKQYVERIKNCKNPKHKLEIASEQIDGLGWSTFGIWFVYMMFIPIIGMIPFSMWLNKHDNFSGWGILIMIWFLFSCYILPILLAGRWRKKRIIKHIDGVLKIFF